MAETVTLAPLTSLTNDTSAIATINSNSQSIETAFADCLSLSGSSPNAMQSNLDMNNNQILNLPSPATINSPARLIDIVANPTLLLTVPPVGTSGATVPLLNGNNTFSGINLFTAGFQDTTSVTGSGALAKFYNPTYFGAAGTGIVDRLNRVLIGGATASSSDLLTGPPILPTTPCWLDTLTQQPIVGEAQLAVLHTWGAGAIVGASRSSDYRAALGAATGGATGLLGVGVNDDTSGNPIATGINAIVLHRLGCTGISTNQFDCNSVNPVVDVTPFGGIVAGSTFAQGLTPGAYASLSTDAVSAAMWVGVGATQRFRKGIIFFDGSLDTSVGGGTNGLAIEMARNMSVRWLNSTGSADTEMWANASGLFINSTVAATGSLFTNGGMLSVSPSIGVGYSTGAGGVITQATSKATGVTLNKITGQITTSSASLAAGATVIFAFTNSTITAKDTILIQQTTGAQSYVVYPVAIGAGTANIAITNNGSTASEAIVLNYTVIKGASS